MAALSLNQVDIHLGSDVEVEADLVPDLASSSAGLPTLGRERRGHSVMTQHCVHYSSDANATPKSTGKLPKQPFATHFRFTPLSNPDSVLVGLGSGTMTAKPRRPAAKALADDVPASPLLKMVPSLRNDRVARGRTDPLGGTGGRDAEKEQQLVAYLSSYEKEQVAFSSTYIWCDVLLQKVAAELVGQPRPHPVRAAVGCMLLNRLASLFTRYEKLIHTLADELYASLYAAWPEPPPDPRQGSAYSIAAFLERPTFFTQLQADHREETNRKVGAFRDRLLRVVPKLLVRVQAPYQNIVKRTAFQVWRAYVVERRKQSSIESQLHEQEERRRRNVLGQCFRSWRQTICHEREVRMLTVQLEAATDELEWTKKRVETLDAKALLLEKDNQELRRNTSALARTMQSLSGTLARYQASLSEIAAPPMTDVQGPGSAMLSPELVVQMQQLCEKGVLEQPKPEAPPVQDAENITSTFDGANALSEELQDTLRELQEQVTEVLAVEKTFVKDLDRALGAGKATKKIASSTKRNSSASSPSAAKVQQPEEEEEDNVVRNPSVQHLLVWLNLRLQHFPDDCPNYVVSLTTDFRDSIKLACLLQAIGGAEASDVVEEVKAIRPDKFLDRAALVIRKAEQLLADDLSELIKPSDIVKGRGTQMAKFFLRLYDYTGGEDADVMENHEKIRTMISVLRKATMNFEFAFTELYNRQVKTPPDLRRNERLARKSQKRRPMREVSDLAPLAQAAPVTVGSDVELDLSPKGSMASLKAVSFSPR